MSKHVDGKTMLQAANELAEARTPASEHLTNIAKAVISAVPLAGGTIASLIDVYIPKARERRVVEFLIVLARALNDVEDRLSGAVMSDEFARLLTLSLNAVANEHRSEKINAFKGILTSFLLIHGDFDVVESYIRRLDQLGTLHLSVLKICLGPLDLSKLCAPAESMSIQIPGLESAGRYQLADFLRQHLPSVDYSVLVVAVNDLVGLGLLAERTSSTKSGTIEGGGPTVFLPQYGVEFMRYVIGSP